ncbi:RHS repeat-associated core domain-containing protein [Kitasatospora sp. NPDC096128]|uniref:DNA/RNA non-specific endonuclease n=1 Tax=Kitasatospora sp. NPDC096128 TaxID=3155547 RepID=UPI00332827C4
MADPQTGSTLAYGYTPTGRVATIQYGTGNTRSYTYDDQGNVTGDSVKTGTGTAVSSLAYTYYPSGRLKTQTTNGLAGATTHTYGYDAAGRLSTWNNGAATTAYAYDGNGNLTSNGTTTATYNQRNQLSSAGTTSYTYTARGTRTAATTGTTTTSATYDAFDELTGQGGQSYAYDALGRLTTSAGHTFTYDATSNNLTSDGTENYTRTPSGGLTSIGNPTGSAFAYSDRHGNLVGTFTATGTATAGSSAYDPWGKPTATAGTTHDLGYQGGWTDPTSGQVSTASRWYDPATADFTSRDTANLAPVTAAGANRYAYGAGDPLSNADPSGHNPCEPDNVSPDAGPEGDGSGDSAAASAPAYSGMSASAWERKAQHMADMEIAEAASRKASYNYMSYAESSANNHYFQVINAWEKWSDVPMPASQYGHLMVTESNGWAYSAPYSGETESSMLFGYQMKSINMGGYGMGAQEDYEHAAGYSSCDTDGSGPAPRHHRKFPPPPPRSDQSPAVDPHNLDPVACTVCSTQTPQGRPLNGPEDGKTQTGTPVSPGAAPDSPFVPSGDDPGHDHDYSQGLLIKPGSVSELAPSDAPPVNEKDCAAGNSATYYMPLDNMGRAQGAMACLAKGDYNYVNDKGNWAYDTEDTNIVGTATEFPINWDHIPQGYYGGKILHRGHLLARQLGGDGNDLRNLVPLYAAVNTPTMKGYEDRLAARIQGGETYFYSVVPEYEGESKIPVSVTLRWAGSFGDSDTVVLKNRPKGTP